MPRRNTSIHIKNLADGVRHEELRHAFGKFGRVVDVTVPVNYHTGRPKGFAFCTFEDPRDAEDAVYHMNKTRFAGREISVEFTRGTRKTPAEMRARDSGSRSGRSWRSRSRSRTPRRRRSSRDRSDSRDRRRRHDDYRRRSYSRSPEEENGRNGRRRDSVDDRRSRSPSAERSQSRGDASRSPSPRGRYSQSPGLRPAPEVYISETEVDRKAIRKQLEFYFSDANLSHDPFFCTELKRSSDESIGFDLLLRCNKLRALGATTKDHLVEALSRSKSLKINDLDLITIRVGTGVQRVKPYNPARTPSDCIVLATGLNFFNSPRLPPIKQGEDDDAEETFQEERDGDGMSTDEVIDFLKGQLKDYGKVKYVHVPRILIFFPFPLRFKTSGSLRGFAFVEFGSKKAADNALSTLAPTEYDLVRTPLIPASIKGRKTVGEAEGWMPKTAPYATSLSLSERLARQMVWRCCARRSKQERAAFRRLLHAGYRRPNPLDAECWCTLIYSLVLLQCDLYLRVYADCSASLLLTSLFSSCFAFKGCVLIFNVRRRHVSQLRFTPPPLVDHLITEGSTISAEEGKATEERRERLRLLPYSDWELWRTRFYQWQRAWVTRMNSKAEKLSAQAERKMRTVSIASTSKVTSPHSEPAANGSPHSTSLGLPSSYSPGTVVEVLWPVETKMMNQDLRKQMRHVRLAIEASVLQPHNLLHSVAHFDTQSSHQLLPLHRHQRLPSTLVDPNGTARVYIRFKEPQGAKTFVSAITESGTDSFQDGVDAKDAYRQRSSCSAEILEGEREAEYCAAIAASKAGAAERRRRAQAAKRRKKVKSQNAVSPP
ncbi:unnamed protein product [Hymenolepis diminuta]|uniref:RRM domain-containing protein n=2 Tax=Hymenolepis diminuta TaxID=6216 RepID=A0A0R3SCX5_HYMDI|nr:unnamed protein product [Hymenolepis diminuta]